MLWRAEFALSVAFCFLFVFPRCFCFCFPRCFCIFSLLTCWAARTGCCNLFDPIRLLRLAVGFYSHPCWIPLAVFGSLSAPSWFCLALSCFPVPLSGHLFACLKLAIGPLSHFARVAARPCHELPKNLPKSLLRTWAEAMPRQSVLDPSPLSPKTRSPKP